MRLGGEIFVPKIPSYRITDIAEAIGPECEVREVGVRPGEKIHEEMITASDSLNTIDLGPYFAILPSTADDQTERFLKKHGGKLVEPGFCYNSGTNPDFSIGRGIARANSQTRRSNSRSLMSRNIPYGRQSICEADIAAVVDVLRSDFLTQGPAVPAFENALAKACNAKYGIASSSATSALHLACKALGVGPGHIVWTSPITFVASSNAALYCGAKVDFVDIDERTYNMCPEHLARKLEEAANAGALPKVVIPVHLAGQSCDMQAIHSAASKYGVRVIEDASHAVGGIYRSQPVGNLRISATSPFSAFNPVKIVTTGEGGLAMTNDPDLADLMRLDRSHGITRNPHKLTSQDQGGWYYEQQSLGFNYRMTDISAALGLSQLARLGEFIERRREIASIYDTALSDLPIKTPWQNPDAQSAWHLYIIRVSEGLLARDRRNIFEELREAGIGVNLHYIPVYLQPYYRDLGFEPGHCPNAEAYYSEAISLPIFPTMTNEEQEFVIETVTKGRCTVNLAIIPARGGSKRIPRKNVREFCGRPMICWPITTALASGLFDRVVVSTDDPEIAEVARQAGAETPFMRPVELSDDHTGTNDVVIHALEWAREQCWVVDAACCIYATAAFVSSQDILDARELLSSDCEFSFTAVRYAHPPQRGFFRSAKGAPELLQPEHQTTRTQDLEPIFHDAGQFYWGTREAWLEQRPFFGEKTRFIELPQWRACDIDRPEDWVMAERLFAATQELGE